MNVETERTGNRIVGLHHDVNGISYAIDAFAVILGDPHGEGHDFSNGKLEIYGDEINGKRSARSCPKNWLLP